MKTKEGNKCLKTSTQRMAQRAAKTTSRGLACLLLLTALLASETPALAGAVGVSGKPSLDIMTANLYSGGGTARVMALDPTDPGYFSNLIATVTGIYYEIAASQPAVRLQGVAEEIAARRPDIVAVQEASLIRTQSPGDLILGGTTPATSVVYDYLQILTNALAAQGAHYAVVSTADEIDVEMPMFNLQTGNIDDVRWTDREAILVRTDLPRGQLHVSHPRSGNFTNVIQIPSLGLSVLRGWCSVDVFLRGQVFRYICTHLEEETVPQLQMLQAKELLAGPARIHMPVILCGDFNADPLHRNGTQTYDALIAAGFTDAWAVRHPANPAGGLTWGHDEYLADPNTPMIWRLDLVLSRGGRFAATRADVRDIGLNRTQFPLWASDHAAVEVDFQLRKGR